MSTVSVVTGGSSGIGRTVCTLLAQKGHIVYELSRSGEDYDSVRHITTDVTNEFSVRAAVDTICQLEGHIDLLICNAGFGISGAVEAERVESAQHIFDVNFFGTVRAIRAVIPHMRSQHSGKIICLSSVAAPCAIPFQAYYSCTKSAINTLVCALRNELSQFGIKVCAVMPGDIKTGFTASREKNTALNDVYGGAVERAVTSMERDEQGGMSPECVASTLLRVAKKKNPRPLYTVGMKYKFFVFLVKILPLRLSNWIIGKMYG